jgi:hypothetical protein
VISKFEKSFADSIRHALNTFQTVGIVRMMNAVSPWRAIHITRRRAANAQIFVPVQTLEFGLCELLCNVFPEKARFMIFPISQILPRGISGDDDEGDIEERPSIEPCTKPFEVSIR